MKFRYNELENATQFIAISETKEETYGLRAQGPYAPIHLLIIINYSLCIEKKITS